MATATKKAAPRAATKTAAKAAEMTKEIENHAEAAFSTANTQFETMFTAFSDAAEKMRAQSEELMESMRENAEATQNHLQSVNTGLMTAARDEVAEAVDFANELGRAKTFSDALEIQREYWTNLFSTRVERARELTDASVETARQSFEPLNKSMAAFSPASFEKFFPFAAK